jgi:membrane-bound inhibitor of C-type lysozyme
MADAPISFTTHYNLSKWAEGSNPGAVALNSQWDLIDNVIYLKENPLSFSYPLLRTSNVISLNINAVNLKLTSNALDTIQSIATTATPQFAKIGIGGTAPTSVYIAKIYGSQNVTGDLVVDGGLQVNGTLTFLNSDTLQVEDKNIEMGKVTTPTDTTANGGGITLLGATNKTIIWDSTNSNWTSSEHFNLASGKSYKSNNVVVIDSSRQGFLSKLGINTITIASGDVISINGNTKSIGDIYSGNWSQGAEPYVGYYIGQNGSVFGKLNATELHVKNFISDLEQALVGSQIISKSAAKLASDFTIGAAVGSTATLTVEEIEGYTGQVFANNDNIRLRVTTRGSSSLTVADIWGTVVYIGRVAATKTQTYTFTKTSGTGTSITKGTLAIDYGVDGDGVLESVAINPLGRQAYTQTMRFNATALTTTIQSRLGDITGITSDTWGALSGQGLYSQRGYLEKDVYIAESVTIGGRSLGVMQGQTALFHFDTNLQDSINGAKPSYTGVYNETDGLITATGLVCSKASGKFGGGIAVEEATTNLSTGVITNWTGTNVTISADVDNFYFLNETAVTGTHIAVRSFSASSGSTYTGSIYVKASKGRRYVTLAFSAYGNWTGGGGGETTFDLWNGTVSSHNNPLDKGIENLGNQTYRLWITAASSATFTPNFAVSLRSDASTSSYLGVVGNGILVKWAQVEAKTYRTSYVEGSRAYGALSFANDVQVNKTYLFWFKYNGRYAQGTYLIRSVNAASQRLGVYIGTDMQLGVEANAFISTGYYLNNIAGQDLSGQWALCTITIDDTNIKFYLNNTLIRTQPHGNVLPTNPIYLGAAATLSQTSVYYDEFTIFNRALTQEEINKIYGSNQPFAESLQLTRIDGSQIVTGKLTSQNWQSLVAGTQLDLNKGYLELNNGTTNLFKFDSQVGTAKISTFDFTDKLLSNSTLGITIGDYTGATITNGVWLGNRTVSTVNYRELILQGTSKSIRFANTSDGDTYGIIMNSSYSLAMGDLTPFGLTGFGQAAFQTGTPANLYFKLATDGNKIAAFSFDQNVLKYTQTINSVAYDTIKLGSFTGDPTDVSTDISSTLLPEGAINTTTQYNAWTLYAPDWTDRVRYDTATYYGASGGSFGMTGYDGSAKPSTFYARWMIEKTSISAYLGKTIEISYRAMWSTAEPSANPTVSFTIISWWFHPTLSQWRIIKTKVDKRTAPNQGSWNQFTFQFAIPPNTEKLQFYVELEYPSQTLVNACNVDDITIKEYGTTQTWISSEGFQVRSSPLSYLKLQYGKFDIATASLKVNGFDAATWGGVISDATRPTNPVDGLFVYNSTTSKLEFYNGSGWRTVTTA